METLQRSARTWFAEINANTVPEKRLALGCNALLFVSSWVFLPRIVQAAERSVLH